MSLHFPLSFPIGPRPCNSHRLFLNRNYFRQVTVAQGVFSRSLPIISLETFATPFLNWVLTKVSQGKFLTAL